MERECKHCEVPTRVLLFKSQLHILLEHSESSEFQNVDESWPTMA